MKHIHRKRKHQFITTYIIAGGFFLLIVLGTLLLRLPISSASGAGCSWSDALFTATTSVCVTGLVTLPTYAAWSAFGQAVILLLIQIGGLGLVTFTLFFLQLAGRRMGMRERQLIRDAYNLDSDNGMGEMVRWILRGTLAVEGCGAVLYALVFVPEFGARGLWMSVFNAVSAFCNAGMDVIGPSSLMPYRDHVLINAVTMLLIVLGGLGFPIWFLAIERMRRVREKKVRARRAVLELPLYAKVVLLTTAVLIFGGALVLFLLERTNPDTLGGLSVGRQLQAALFQSVATRTAGFCTIPQEGLRRASMVVCCVLMFIGGSPSGTAGGIKTTTFVILLASLFSALSDRDDTELMHRKLHAATVRKALSVFLVSFIVMFLSLLVFCMVQPGAFEDCLYEVVSAIATVGLSRDLTSHLTLGGKLVIIGTMYLGRIGPISLALFFNGRKYVNAIHYPEENVPVG